MHQFIDSISSVSKYLANLEYNEALSQVNLSFQFLLYDESDTPLVLNASMIGAVNEARKTIEEIVKLPEIEETDYIHHTLENMQNSIEAYLQDEIDDEVFWNEVIELAKLTHYLNAVAEYLAKKQTKLGENENPTLSIALNQDGKISLYGRFTEEGGMSLEDASVLQQEFMKNMAGTPSSATQLLNIAGTLLTAKHFKEAIEAYEAILDKFPKEASICFNAIGAAHYYLENYETALEYYIKSLHAGESAERIEYNVWESCEALIKQASSRNEKMKWKLFYKEHFPNPNYDLFID